MKRRDHTFSAGLCVSLLAHGAIVFVMLVVYIRQLQSRLWQPPATRVVVTATGEQFSPSEFQIGEEYGVGNAIAPLVGDAPMKAPLASQDQPFTSLDPSGFGRVSDLPSPSPLPMGKDGTNAPVAFGVPSNEPPAEPRIPSKLKQPDQPTPKVSESSPTADEGSKPKPTPILDEPPPADASEPTPPTAGARPGAPGTAVASADPAPQSDSEIDPFSKGGEAQFRPGRTSVQFGRKAKLTRPRILLPGQLDLIGVAIPRVTLGIHTDATGRVTDVVIAKSSGSENIDQPVRVAAFDWWFEPPKDRDGKALPDEFAFTIMFLDG